MRSKAVEIAMEYPVCENFVGRLRATAVNESSDNHPPIPTHYLDLYNHKCNMQPQPISDSKISNPLEQKNQLFGSAVHFYLSFIKHNKPGEHKLAQWQLTRDFGNIFSITEIESVIQKSTAFISANPDIFSEKWDKVFNEYSIYDTNNKLYRIDRLMIDTQNREIRIIDYKTGSITDDNQIERYIEIISSLPAFAGGKYKISGEYVRVSG
jgi:hypothetical protein